MTEVTLLAAFAAGTLALVSPCSALLLPSFFAYAFGTRRALIARTALFYLGLLVVLVPLGMGSSLASAIVYGNRQTMIVVAGWLIVALGVFQAVGGGFSLPFVDRLRRARDDGDSDRRGTLSTITLGSVYGLAGFCSGPILGAILTMAATSPNPTHGGVLLAVYALGMAAPLFALALVWDRYALGGRRWLRGRPVTLGPVRTHTTSLVSGGLFMVVGILFLRTDGLVGLGAPLGGIVADDLEVSLHERIAPLLGAMPDWTLATAVALVAGVVAWRRTRSGTDPDRVGKGAGDLVGQPDV